MLNNNHQLSLRLTLPRSDTYKEKSSLKSSKKSKQTKKIKYISLSRNNNCKRYSTLRRSSRKISKNTSTSRRTSILLIRQFRSMIKKQIYSVHLNSANSINLRCLHQTKIRFLLQRIPGHSIVAAAIKVKECTLAILKGKC